MLGNFSYCNPTKLHFGPEALDALAGELLFGRLRHGGLVRLGVKDNELVLQFPDAPPAQGAEAEEGDDGRKDA